jgi:hypothetical protein
MEYLQVYPFCFLAVRPEYIPNLFIQKITNYMLGASDTINIHPHTDKYTHTFAIYINISLNIIDRVDIHV